MSKVRNFSEIAPNIAFPEFNFYELYYSTFEKRYATMCELSGRLGIHRSRTKSFDVQKANLTYSKQRKHSSNYTRKITRRLLDLLGKILKETLATRELKTGTTARRTGYRHLS